VPGCDPQRGCAQGGPDDLDRAFERQAEREQSARDHEPCYAGVCHGDEGRSDLAAPLSGGELVQLLLGSQEPKPLAGTGDESADQ
jgi:hypothetical protein